MAHKEAFHVWQCLNLIFFEPQDTYQGIP